MKTAKIDFLQVIRAFAAIFVLLHHGSHMVRETVGYDYLDSFFVSGFAGVDVFFVLSGFIIYHTASKKHLSFREFITRRFVRVYPIYWVMTLFLLLAYFLSPSADQMHKGDWGVIVGSFLLWPQEKYVVGVAWTLTYEIVFYLVFAISFLKKPVYLSYVFAAWIAVILTCSVFGLQTGIYAIDSLLNPIVIDFAFGCAIAYFFKRLPVFGYGSLFAILGGAAFVAACFIYRNAFLQDATAFAHPFSRVYLFGLPAAICIFGGLYIQAKMPNWIVYLGDASYSIYLIHGTVLSVLLKIAGKLGFWPLLDNFAGATLLFVLTIAVGSAFYAWIENPLLRIINTWLKPEKMKLKNAS